MSEAVPTIAQSEDVVATSITPEQEAEHERRQAESDRIMAQRAKEKPSQAPAPAEEAKADKAEATHARKPKSR